jgi:hypothetical protein
MVDGLRSEGIRASFKHKPIYHHETRLEPHTSDVFSMEGGVSSYVNASDVETQGLSVKVLKGIGLEALAAARIGAR